MYYRVHRQMSENADEAGGAHDAGSWYTSAASVPMALDVAVRYVSANGGMRWTCAWVNVSIICAGEYVGLEEIDEGIWNVYFGPLKIGRLHERHMRIKDEYGRLKRHHV